MLQFMILKSSVVSWLSTSSISHRTFDVWIPDFVRHVSNWTEAMAKWILFSKAWRRDEQRETLEISLASDPKEFLQWCLTLPRGNLLECHGEFSSRNDGFVNLKAVMFYADVASLNLSKQTSKPISVGGEKGLPSTVELLSMNSPPNSSIVF